LLVGGMHGLPGLRGCGLQLALKLAKTNLGEDLLNAAQRFSESAFQRYLPVWQQLLCHELERDPNNQLGCLHPAVAASVNGTFPSLGHIKMLLNPTTSFSLGQEAPQIARWVSVTPNLPLLGLMCEHYFTWGHRRGIINKFHSHVWAGMCVRILIARLTVHPQDDVLASLPTIFTRISNYQQRLPATSFAGFNVVIATGPFCEAAQSQLENSVHPHHRYCLPPQEMRYWIPAPIVERALPQLVADYRKKFETVPNNFPVGSLAPVFGPGPSSVRLAVGRDSSSVCLAQIDNDSNNKIFVEHADTAL